MTQLAYIKQMVRAIEKQIEQKKKEHRESDNDQERHKLIFIIQGMREAELAILGTHDVPKVQPFVPE